MLHPQHAAPSHTEHHLLRTAHTHDYQVLMNSFYPLQNYPEWFLIEVQGKYLTFFVICGHSLLM